MTFPVTQWSVIDANFDNGMYQSVGMTDDGLIVEVHAGSPPDNSSVGTTIYSRFGTFPADLVSGLVSWTGAQLAVAAEVASLSVDASRAGVVAIYADESPNIYRITAPLPAAGATTLDWSAPQSFDSGQWVDVAMNNSGGILFVHQSSKALRPEDLFFGWGTFDGGMSTGVSLQGLSAHYPKVAMNGAGQVIIAYATDDNTLWLMGATYDASQPVPLTNCGAPVSAGIIQNFQGFDVAIDAAGNFVVVVGGNWLTGTLSGNTPSPTPWLSLFPTGQYCPPSTVAMNAQSQLYVECSLGSGTSTVAEEYALAGCVGLIADGSYATWMADLVASDPAASAPKEIVIMDMNHLFAYVFGGSTPMTDPSVGQLVTMVTQTLGNLILDTSFITQSLEEIWSSESFANGGRVFVFLGVPLPFPYDDKSNLIALSAQVSPPPANAQLVSLWPSVASLPDLENALSTGSNFLPAQTAAWSRYLSKRDASSIPFNVTQCIATPGEDQIFSTTVNTLIQWEAQICTPAQFWLFEPSNDFATALNIVLVDEVQQTMVTAFCIAANRAKAAALGS